MEAEVKQSTEHSTACARRNRVVVGFDYEIMESERGLKWAMREAQLRRTCLHVIHGGPERKRNKIEERVRTFAENLPGLPLVYAVDSVETDATDSLVAAAHGAALLVLSSRNRGNMFLGAIERSISRRAAARAACPIAIISSDTPSWTKEYERIVVGIDNTLSSRDALQFAAGEAAWRGCAVCMVHVLERSEPEVWVDRLSYLKNEVFVGDLSQVEVYGSLQIGPESDALIAETRQADLLVLGARGYGKSSDVLRGSVTKDCLDKAKCPVVIAPSAPEDRLKDVRKAVSDLAEEWARENPIDMQEVVEWLFKAIEGTRDRDTARELIQLLSEEPNPDAYDDTGVRIREMTDYYPREPGLDPRWRLYPPRDPYWRLP